MLNTKLSSSLLFIITLLEIIVIVYSFRFVDNIQSTSNTQIELLQKRDSMLLQNQLNLQRQIDQTSKDLIRFERQISQYD